MIIVTSISPKHKNYNYQSACIETWATYGQVYSLNAEEEIASIGTGSYPLVKILPTDKTVFHIFGKSLVNINAMIDIAKIHHQDLLILNSDIYLQSLPDFKMDGITILPRYDYEESMGVSQKFEDGFDIFFIPNKFLSQYPPSIYGLGNSWWDLWIPYRAIVNNIPVYTSDKKHGFHKKHTIQYSLEEWYKLGRNFSWEFDLGHNTHDALRKAQPLSEITVQQVCARALTKIKQHLIHI